VFTRAYLIHHVQREVVRLRDFYRRDVPRAIAHWAVREVDPGLSDDQAFEVVRRGGAGDGGMDGIWIHSSGRKLCVVQVKTSAALVGVDVEDVDEDDPSGLAIDTFDGEAVNDLDRALTLLTNPLPPTASEKLVRARQEYAKARGANLPVELLPIVFGHRGRGFEAALRALNRRLSATRNLFPQHRIKPLDIDSLNELMDENFQAPTGTVQISMGPWKFKQENVAEGVTLGLVDAHTFVKLREDNKQRIYHANFRYMLGMTQVRIGMSKTLSDDNESSLFHLYHNGITVLGKDISIQANQITIHEPQIVNGLQTVETLYDFATTSECKENLGRVFILTRFIDATKLPPAGPDGRLIEEKIAEYSNRQNPITPRDLRSNDRVQKRLQHDIASMGFKYRRKRGEDWPRGLRDIVDNEDAAQRSLAFWAQLPIEARNRKKLLFVRGVEDPGGLYDQVFPGNVPAEALVLPWLLYKGMASPRSAREEEILKHSWFVLLAMFGKVFQARYHVRLSNASTKVSTIREFIRLLRDGKLDPDLKRVWKELRARLVTAGEADLRIKAKQAAADGKRAPSARNVMLAFPYRRRMKSLLPPSKVTSLAAKLPRL
jgi:hypothetical protein